MLKVLVGLSLWAVNAFALGSVFSFKDVAGFEKCLNTESLLHVAKSESSDQARFVNQGEIQDQCIATALELLESRKSDKVAIMEFIEATKRNSAPERSLDLIQLLVGGEVSACNDMPVYEVLLKSLGHPKDYPSKAKSYFQKTHEIVKVCLKDKTFRADFSEEKDNGNSYISANACQILKDEKIVSSCKGGSR